ncbi:hypothetical protein HYU96_04005 [Candidatus Daviesbacteria bacterium]|nr:hypothetical protein [Candidatus Daviesbacteria bacterium]
MNKGKIIFVILGAALLIEIIYAVWVLNTPAPVPPPETVSLPKTVSLSLYSPRSEFKKGEVVSVTVNLDTGTHETEGADLLLSFDPKVLEATAGAVLKGVIYPEYPQTRIDQKTGSIAISGISGLIGKTFQGSGVFATVNFKAKAVGQATLSIKFTPGQTNDSNVVEALSGNDILENVSDLTLTLQ